MVEIRPFLQFVYFVPHAITAQPKIIMQLLNEFQDWSLLPTTVPGFQLNGDQGLNQVMQLQLISEKKDLVINFEPQRYNIQFNSIPGKEILKIEECSEKIFRIITTLNRLVPYKATRLSVVTKSICKKMSLEEINHINENLFSLPKIFNENHPVEWNTRQVIRKEINIKDRVELINIVFDIGKIQILSLQEGHGVPEDRIELGFDINTYQANLAQRFSPEYIIPFINETVRIQNEIEKEMKDLCYA